jgi:hypothetical protein
MFVLDNGSGNRDTGSPIPFYAARLILAKIGTRRDKAPLVCVCRVWTHPAPECDTERTMSDTWINSTTTFYADSASGAEDAVRREPNGEDPGA